MTRKVLQSGNDNPLQRRSLWSDETAATSLEWLLLLAVIVIPSYVIIDLAIASLVGHYQMMTMINSLPFP